MARYVLPAKTPTVATFSSAGIVFEMEDQTVSVEVTNCDLALSGSALAPITITNDPVNLLSAFLGLDRLVTQNCLQHTIHSVRGLPYATALHDFMVSVRPFLGEIHTNDLSFRIPDYFPVGFDDAFREIDIRNAASVYWGEPKVGAAAARAWGESLVVDGTISECRVSWMGLVSSDLRPELVQVPLAGGLSAIPVRAEYRSTLATLKNRTAVEVVKLAMADPQAPLFFAAAHRLGFQAEGQDPKRILMALKNAARSAKFCRTATLGQYVAARGLAGQDTTILASNSDLVLASSRLGNCLNNPNQPWKEKVLSGQCEIVVVGSLWDRAAIAFEHDHVVEAKGPANGPLPAQIQQDLARAVAEWKQQNGS